MPDGGYLYITAFEGDEPATMVQRLVQADHANEEFVRWLFKQMQDIHGVDASQGAPPHPSRFLTRGRSKPKHSL